MATDSISTTGCKTRGPLPTDFTHILNLAGVTHLRWGFELGLNFSFTSAPPFNAFVGGIDFNGDGTTDDLLPGTTMGQFNRGLGRSDLVRLVNQFNQTYAGTNGSRPSHPAPDIAESATRSATISSPWTCV